MTFHKSWYRLCITKYTINNVTIIIRISVSYLQKDITLSFIWRRGEELWYSKGRNTYSVSTTIPCHFPRTVPFFLYFRSCICQFSGLVIYLMVPDGWEKTVVFERMLKGVCGSTFFSSFYRFDKPSVIKKDLYDL